MPGLIRRLGLSDARPTEGEREREENRLRAVEAALLALEKANAQGEIGGLHYARLSNAYQLEHDQLVTRIKLPAQADEPAPQPG